MADIPAQCMSGTPPALRDPASDPVVLPGRTSAGMTDHVCGIALREQAFLWWWIAMAPCLHSSAACWSSRSSGCSTPGVGIWGIDWPVMWGFAIINYVWWIAIASGGTFISALFYLVARRVADLAQPHRRIDDAVRRCLRGHLPNPASRPAMVVLLAVPLSGHDDTCGRSSAARCCGIFSRS